MIVDEGNRIIGESIPLTRPTGKIRVKTRSMYYEYGQPFSSRKFPFTHNNYMEWQISYDNEKRENAPSHCDPVSYVGRGREKFLTELSFYLYQFYKWGIIGRDRLVDLNACLEDTNQEDVIANHEHCSITRTHPREMEINGIPFSVMTLRYPQLVYHFDIYEIIAEITIREKQRAVGVQPMLYFCIPISELRTDPPLIGRIAERNEVARFDFSEDNYRVILEMVKIFGILSMPHREDIMGIIQRLLDMPHDQDRRS